MKSVHLAKYGSLREPIRIPLFTMDQFNHIINHNAARSHKLQFRIDSVYLIHLSKYVKINLSSPRLLFSPTLDMARLPVV